MSRSTSEIKSGSFQPPEKKRAWGLFICNTPGPLSASGGHRICEDCHDSVRLQVQLVLLLMRPSEQLLPQIQAILHTADKLPASNRTQLVKAFKSSFDLIEVIFETPRVSHPPTRDQPGSKTYKDRSSIAFSYRPTTNQQ